MVIESRLDLVGIPRKPCVFALSAHCTDEGEANAMKWLCSKGKVGHELWVNFVEAQRLGIVELLALFPSCCPPLHVLATFLSPLAPRPYSIASSPLAHPSSVVIAFSVVRYSCGLSSTQKCCEDSNTDSSTFCIKRSGFCTSYLEGLLQPFLLASDGSYVDESISLRVLWKPSISFRLPGNMASPLILIGMYVQFLFTGLL
jgi:sulfite reductase alpha subunit-like flavoprotein